MPRTDVCLDSMTGARWFSTFDLRSGYHQVELAKEDADKTAFVCREGMFRFTAMPFGLCNAGATFQRLMDVVLSGLAFEICLVYLDDVIVFSATLEQHLERLSLVLTRLIEAGLKLKGSKCYVLQQSVEFLGHIVSGEGISPHPSKVSAVVDWPTPCTLKEVRAFLGLAGYYRRFMLGFSDIAAPLYELTTKGKAFVWTQQCQEAFDELKLALTRSPILGTPDDSGMFVLDTDASDVAVGAVLSQVQDGAERVISYGSRSLSTQERNYCVTRRELLAIIVFLKYFRHYLIGRKFLIRSDHAALQWLRRIPQPIGQQARWLELMEEYEFEVKHRSGSRHGNADAMSRRPCDRTRCCPKTDDGDNIAQCFTVVTVDSPGDCALNSQDEVDWSAAAIGTEQLSDTAIGPIAQAISDGKPRPSWDEIAAFSEETKALWRQWNRLKLFQGCLVRRFEKPEGGLQCLQTVMPKARRSAFIEILHAGVNGGHLGRRRTRRSLQLRAYWPGWTRDVERNLLKCSPCARYRRGPPPKQVPLKPFLSGEPWEVVSVDITGPHPRSRRGNEYMVTLQDHFTKWAEAIPVRNHTAPTVAWALFANVFVRFGMPLRLLTDQGAEFEGQLFSDLCRHMEISKIRTTPYKPSTNGMVERFHKTLNSMLAKVISADQRDWCEHVPAAMAAYRASSHETTGFSPNFLMFGREARLPVDVIQGRTMDGDEQPSTVDEFVERLTDRTQRAFDITRNHLQLAANRRKSRYDDGVRNKIFNQGSGSGITIRGGKRGSRRSGKVGTSGRI